jgi:hypothetical protein
VGDLLVGSVGGHTLGHLSAVASLALFLPQLASASDSRIPGVEAIARAVRIYGTGSTRPAPEDQPFVAESFPQPGDRCSVYLGVIPSAFEDELRHRNAFLTAALKRVFMHGELLDQAVPATLDEQAGQPPVPGKHAWHVTYVFERTVDVPPNPEAPPDSPYQWLDLNAWSDVDAKLREEATDAFDALLAYTVGTITPTFFDHVALPLAMYYVADGGRIAMVPQFQAGGLSPTVSHTSPFPSEALRDRMVSIGQQAGSRTRGLGASGRGIGSRSPRNPAGGSP